MVERASSEIMVRRRRSVYGVGMEEAMGWWVALNFGGGMVSYVWRSFEARNFDSEGGKLEERH